MSKRGELFVFEGPDGVGKSTLSAKFAAHLQGCGIETEHLSFPGRDVGTLGKVVYDIHHEPASHGVDQLTSASLQALHIAAHLDAIERRIIPAMNEGKTVVLDRFWWSTWVYGIVGGISPKLLKSLLRVEREQWGKFLPTTVFLITRPHSWREDETHEGWQRLATAYRELAAEEAGIYPVELVPNEEDRETVLDRTLSLAGHHSPSQRLQLFVHLEVEPQSKKKRP